MSEKKSIHLDYVEFDSSDALSASDQVLLSKAREILNTAYAPYSKFHVGAAILLDDGSMIEGNNQENVAYPSGLCAERVALFYASSKFPKKKVMKVAISARSEEFEVDYPITPCGACRQALLEYEVNHEQKIEVILAGHTGKVIVVPSISWLLPLSFSEGKLKK